MSRLHLPYFLARRIASRGASDRHSVMIRIATLSVAIGLVVMIISLAVIEGFKSEVAQKLTGFGAHIQMVNLDGNSSYETVPISINQPFLQKLGNVKGLKSVHPYAIKAGLIRGDEAMQGVVLKGINSSYEESFFADNLSSGRLLELDGDRKKEVIISRKLAQLLSLKEGDPMEMLFIQNPPRRDRFRVVGIYDSQFDELDKIMVLTDIRNVQRLNGWDSTQITGFEMNGTDFAQLDALTFQLDEINFNTPAAEGDHLQVINIKERYPMIFDWLEAHNVNAGVIITVMFVVALFNMIAALLIILMERTAMIGMLKALGMGNRSLQEMFIIRSSFVMLKGMFWGNVVGIGLCLLQHYTGWITLDQSGYFLTTVPISLSWQTLLILNAATFAFMVLLLTLPTLIISRILPEKSIRFE